MTPSSSLLALRKLAAPVAVVVAAGALAACGGRANGTTDITTTSAKLHATGHCDVGESCKFYWEWWKAGSPRSTSVRSTPAGPVNGATSDVALTRDITGLAPNTRYRWVVCGSPNNGGGYGCVGPKGKTGSTTADPPPDSQQFLTHQTGGTKGVAFTSNRDGNTEIYRMAADGTAQTRLTNNSADDQQPTWSPDGTKIAFRSNRDGAYHIYTMSPNGSNQARLTNFSQGDSDPAWSPDGTKIAFTASFTRANALYTMNPDGSGLTMIDTQSGGNLRPTWSPDGTKIALGSVVGSDFELVTINVDDTGVTRLTNSLGDDLDPAWSPDGKKISFTSHRDGPGQIYVMNADGSGQVKLTDNDGPLNDNTHPTWSPDGSKVAFDSDRDGDREIVWMFAAGGRGPSFLTQNPAADTQAAWSPLP